jgi:hypothetical protein
VSDDPALALRHERREDSFVCPQLIDERPFVGSAERRLVDRANGRSILGPLASQNQRVSGQGFVSGSATVGTVLNGLEPAFFQAS